MKIGRNTKNQTTAGSVLLAEDRVGILCEWCRRRRGAAYPAGRF